MAFIGTPPPDFIGMSACVGGKATAPPATASLATTSCENGVSAVRWLLIFCLEILLPSKALLQGNKTSVS
jgi:hypothetical protein